MYSAEIHLCILVESYSLSLTVLCMFDYLCCFCVCFVVSLISFLHINVLPCLLASVLVCVCLFVFVSMLVIFLLVFGHVLVLGVKLSAMISMHRIHES